MFGDHQLEKHLTDAANKKVKVKINDNRSTMLSVKWEPDCTKVSIHRMFLEAPKNVMEAIATHVRRKNSTVSPVVRAYIEEKSRGLDYSCDVKATVSTKGNVYDLQEIYNSVNHEYFNGEVDLLITWYGRPASKGRSRVTFGLYNQMLRLIKINRIMDREFFPEYFVNFVVYHEILHHVCPSYFNAAGRHCIHNDAFKKREKEHADYRRAQAWLKRHYEKFFIDF